MIDRSIGIVFSNHLWWCFSFFHPTNISLSRSVWSAPKKSPNPKSVQILWFIGQSALFFRTIYDGGLHFFIRPIFRCPGPVEVREKWPWLCSRLGHLPTPTSHGPLKTWVGSLDPPLDTVLSGNVHFCQICGLGGIAWVWTGGGNGPLRGTGEKGEIGPRVPSPIPPSDFGGPDGWFGSLVSGTDSQSWQDSPLGTQNHPPRGGAQHSAVCLSCAQTPKQS